MKDWQSPGRRGKEQKDSKWSKQQQVKQVVRTGKIRSSSKRKGKNRFKKRNYGMAKRIERRGRKEEGEAARHKESRHQVLG